MIRSARVVLGTQAELAPQTVQWTHELAQVLATLRTVDPSSIHLYLSGLQASRAVTGLLQDNRSILPVLLSDLTTVTTIAQQRIPKLRKALTVFPWILENQVNTTRACDDYDPQTGKPVQSTCHYDDSGKPIYTLHLSQQLDKVQGNPYQACTRGYEGTHRYAPDGEPMSGTGPRQRETSEPNLRVHCAASPYDPVTPNVRGAQNVTTPAYARPGSRVSSSAPVGVVSSAPPSGPQGLAWLFTSLLDLW